MTARTTLFDAYLHVDWSASATPNRGKDSIWIGEAVRSRGRLTIAAPRNPVTRAAASDDVRRSLLGHVVAGRRVLVGFDFVYGFPRGFAEALGLGGPEAPWLRAWRLLAGAIRDGEQNANNRWDVAADLNRRLGAPPGPFWNCPGRVAGPDLLGTKRTFPHVLRDGRCLAEYRICDATMRRTRPSLQSVWKLYTTGSVGSQTLLGIPRLHALYTDAALAPWSRVWPFETGFAPEAFPASGPFVLHAEAWPRVIPDGGPRGAPPIPPIRRLAHTPGDPGRGSKIPVEGGPRGAPPIRPLAHASGDPARGSEARWDAVKDARQVVSLVRHFAELDASAKLAPLFDRPAQLTDEEVAICCEEEGWILGA